MASRRLVTFGGSVGISLVILAAMARYSAFPERNVNRVRVDSLEQLARELELLRAQLRIPGMSAAIAENDSIIWAQGFGMANRELAVPAEPETIYHLASLTKPYASTVLLQLVEEGQLSLDDPVAKFGIRMERSAPVKIWHLLSHTSAEPPGAAYRYDGNAFGALTQVVERTTEQPFAKELADRIIRPLALTRTAPNPGDPRGFRSIVASLTLTPEDIERGRAVFSASGLQRQPIESALAQGYARAWGRWIWPTGLIGPMRRMPHGFTLSATGGLVASAPDVARFSIGLDQGRLLSETSRAKAWLPPRGPAGTHLPYGLGWFVQEISGRQVVWHYGHGLESSSLIVKIPESRATFVMLANSDGLSRWRGLGDKADVTASPAATLFLRWYFRRTTVQENSNERSNEGVKLSRRSH